MPTDTPAMTDVSIQELKVVSDTDGATDEMMLCHRSVAAA